MASIVVQPQDLFFEFDFGKPTDVEKLKKSLSKCKDDVFLIGCFRTDQKNQLDWIRSNHDFDSCGKYNVRLGKGRDGWINKENPRIANPQYAVLKFDNEPITKFKLPTNLKQRIHTYVAKIRPLSDFLDFSQY